MVKSSKITGAAIATAAALLFGSVAITASAGDAAKVKCEGVNGCKGKSECATPKNACAGKNSCKGEGYLMLSKAECDAKKAEMSKS